MSIEINGPYAPKTTEKRIYDLWLGSGYFNPDNLPTKSNKKFSIVIPPPNITGSLHMGHALNAVIQDVLIRKKRMEGYKTLWLPGTDHAGIATQNVVEKNLLKTEGKTRHEIGREKFTELVWQWKEKYGNEILNQLKQLGSSCDWSRARFTMDEDYQKEVQNAFLHYHKKGWIYRAEKVVNWCPKCQTSLSDLELEYKEEKTFLWHIKYPAAEENDKFITVATTRPETMLGDTAVAVSPKDERYKNLVGKKVILPLVEKEIPVIADRRVETEFGTGAVKVTPAHSIIDAEIGEEHKLLSPKVIGPFAKMALAAEIKSTEAAKYDGLGIKEARERIVKDLEDQGLLEKTETYTHNVALCYRCASMVENLPSLQWFLKMKELAEKAIEAVKKGEVKFQPQRWEKIYFDWLAPPTGGVKDWCISRQIWWGHKIPLEGETDVLDTWFSSALWPFSTMKGKDRELFYPTNVLSTARDIINLWVARMVFSGLEFTGKAPFETVLIHPTILTKEGKRMSKSLGTGLDPLKYIEIYGADATRFGLIWQTMGNQDIHWSEEHVLAGKKFLNKIWNASRFVLQQTSNSKTELKNANLTDADKEILQKLDEITKKTTEQIENYQFGQALHDLYDFFWHDFCDKYLEISKSQSQTSEVLLYVLTTSLKLIHPFLPFLTEEIWSKIKSDKDNLLIVTPWPVK